ncbi:MAG: glycosyltransferase family 4 protein [Flavobacteriia bacterium]
MTILHITNKPIYPILDGGQLAMQRLMMNFLHLGYSIKNLTVETHKHRFEIDEYPQEIQQIIYPESHFIDTKVKMWDIVKSLFSSESYNVKRFIDKDFEEKIKDLLQTNEFGIVILESAYLLPYVNIIRKYSDAKIIVRAHNVEYRIWRQAARKEKIFYKRMYYKKLAKNLKKFEINHLNLVDGIFCISEQDKEFFRRRSVRAPLEVIPVYMENIDGYQVDYSNNDFFFVGSMTWKPNIDAVRWIVNQIAPRLLKIFPEVKIHIAGSAMPKSMLEKKIKNVVFHGKVDDMHKFMSEHGTLIVPLKSGSGVRIKILEALSIGVPVISSEKGKEGINLTPKKHFLTANITEEFILQMKFIDDNTELKENLGKEGQRFIKEEYSIEIVSKKISDFISKI